MIWSVYRITHTETGITYAGRTRNTKRARKDHWTRLRCDRHPNPELQATWDFYRPSDFEFTVVAEDLGDLDSSAAVDSMIAEAVAKDLSCNISGTPSSEQRRHRQSEAMKGRKPVNLRRVVASGVTYESICEAARQIGVKASTVHYRIRSPNWPDHQYEDAG